MRTNSSNEKSISEWRCIGNRLYFSVPFTVTETCYKRPWVKTNEGGKKSIVPLWRRDHGGNESTKIDLKLAVSNRVRKTMAPVKIDVYLNYYYKQNRPGIIDDANRAPPVGSSSVDCNRMTVLLFYYLFFYRARQRATVQSEHESSLLFAWSGQDVQVRTIRGDGCLIPGQTQSSCSASSLMYVCNFLIEGMSEDAYLSRIELDSCRGKGKAYKLNGTLLIQSYFAHLHTALK